VHLADCQSFASGLLATIYERTVMFENVDELMEDLIEYRDELAEELRIVDGMIAAGNPPKQRRQPRKQKTAAKKKKARNSNVSQANLDRILDAVKLRGIPIPTRDVQQMIQDLSPASVSKGLSRLRDEGQIVVTGYEHGVRGKRPMYALAGATVSDGGGDDTTE
jgi:hypothetical protein